MIGLTNSLKISTNRDVIGTYVGTSSSTGGSQFINLGFTPVEVTVTCPSNPTSTRFGGTATAVLNADRKTIKSVVNATIGGDYGNTNTLYTPSQIGSFYHYITVAIVENGFYVFYCDPVNGHSQTNNKGVIYNYTAKRG